MKKIIKNLIYNKKLIKKKFINENTEKNKKKKYI